MNLDFRFLIDGAYYYQKGWQAIRYKYPENLDTKKLIEEYAREVLKLLIITILMAKAITTNIILFYI